MFMGHYFILCLALFIGSSYPNPIKTSLGHIRGKTIRLPNFKVVQAYRGIPYAKPPIGDLRFKHPVPAGPWKGVLNATEYGNTCMQFNLATYRSIPLVAAFLPVTPLSEDCLTLNVFVPEPKPSNAPVMVFIHGGGYAISGTSCPGHDVKGLASEENLITVSMNYRLASLGFLYMDHPEIQANCGLMDQLLALRWVNKYISEFGGNPDDVTLFGSSGGAGSIGFHMASPHSNGLFKRAILESGTPTSRLLMQEKNENQNVAFETARRLGCNGKYNRDLNNVVQCLKKANAAKLIISEPSEKLYTFNFKPVYDESFFYGHPIDAPRKSDVFRKLDLMTGVVQNEGTVFLSMIKPVVFPPIFDSVAPYHNEVIQLLRQFLLPDYPEEVYNKIENLYTDWEHFNESIANLRLADSIVKDLVFKCPMDDLISIYDQMGAKVYTYEFTYRSENVSVAKWLGVSHASELRYVMGEAAGEEPRETFSMKDLKFSKRIMRYWANFARTGDPNISPAGRDEVELFNWPKYTAKNNRAIILSAQLNQTSQILESEKCHFWMKNFPKLKKKSC